jgi:microcystin-dependent protein
VLFAVIGTVFGVGNGSSTFNLPDFGANAPVGYKSGDANFGTLGAKVGAAAANLQHGHTVASHQHTIAHTHPTRGSDSVQPISTFGRAYDLGAELSGGSTPATDAQLSTTQSLVQPSHVVNFIIKI